MRGLHDGAGLCSPGRYAEAKRSLSGCFFFFERDEGVLVQGAAALGGGDENAGLVVELEDCAHALAARKFKASPFGWSAICKVREGWKQVLDKAGISSESHPEDPFQAVTVRLLGAVLRSAGDPDSGFPDNLAWGVPLVLSKTYHLFLMCSSRKPSGASRAQSRRRARLALQLQVGEGASARGSGAVP